jgi:hypothetical protein
MVVTKIRVNMTETSTDLRFGMPALPNAVQSTRQENAIRDADWKRGLGLQYVANSASVRAHNDHDGSAVCFHTIILTSDAGGDLLSLFAGRVDT